MPKRENMSDPEVLSGRTAWRGLYCCYERCGATLSTDMPAWCEGFPWRWGPFARRLGASRRFSPPSIGWDSWNLAPTQVGLTTRTERVRLTVQTVPWHRQSSWDKGAVKPIKLRTCTWPRTLVAGEGRCPQVCCNIKRFKSTDEVFRFAQGSTWESVPVKCYIHRRAVHPRTKAQRTQFWLCRKCWSSLHVTLETEAAKQPCFGGLFSSSLKRQHHGRW